MDPIEYPRWLLSSLDEIALQALPLKFKLRTVSSNDSINAWNFPDKTRVKMNGKIYPSISAAAHAAGISNDTMRHWIQEEIVHVIKEQP